MLVKVLKVVVVLFAILFLIMGLRWLVDPAGIAPEFGLVIGDGLGRSSLIGDFSAFFLTLSLCMLAGVVSRRRVWFFPAIMLLGLASLGRITSWFLHDAAFAGSMIGFEIIISLILLAAVKWLPEQD